MERINLTARAAEPVFDEVPPPSPRPESIPVRGRSQQQRLYNKQDEPAEQGNQSEVRKYLRNAFNVNVPAFYDMVKNGTSLGINVLSGLVKVERGDEANRNGLEGRRPLSVRVFGVPVYERGNRVRDPSGSDGNNGSGILSILSGFIPGPNRPLGGGSSGGSGGEPEAEVVNDGLDER